MSDENVAIAQRFNEAFNRRDTDAIAALLDPDCEWEEDPRYPGAETFRGPEGALRSLHKWWDAFAEITAEAVEFVDLGDAVVTSGQTRARGSGSEAEVTAPFGTAARIRDGKVVAFYARASREEALAAVGR